MSMKKFNIIRDEQNKDIKSQVVEYEYIKTGTKVVHIKNEDKNKSFTVGFKTVPTNSTGVAHILEHSVLKGSKKYDVNKLFVELMKGTLSTYLNAMTAYDHTMYPVASMNDADFLNLSNVYMDVLFNPNVLRDEEIFMLEGWMYELKDDKLIENGIVLNEMKGVYSNVDRIKILELSKAMYDNTYSHSSGGYPDDITKLTYNELIEFYNKHYHPSNAIIVVYGDCKINEILEMVDSYISRFEKSEEVKIEKTTKHTKVKRREAFYNVNNNEAIDKKSFFSMGFMIDQSLNTKMNLVMPLIASCLINSESSSIKQELIRKKLCSSIGAQYKNNCIQSEFLIHANYIDKENAQEIEDIIFKGIKKAVKEGFEQKTLESLVNQMEFNLREIKDSYGPVSVMRSMSIINHWKNGASNASEILMYEENIKYLKECIKNGELENVISKYLETNNNRVTLTLIPKVGLTKENNIKNEERLEKYRQSLTNEQIEEIKLKMKKVEAYRNKSDSKEKIAEISKIRISDIKKEFDEYNVVKEENDGVSTYFYETNTNGIVYNSIKFDTSFLKEDEIYTSALLSMLLNSMNTKKYSYVELNNEITNIGSISYDSKASQIFKKPNELLRMFEIGFKSTSENAIKAADLIQEVLLNVNFEDKERVRNVITNFKNYIQSGFSNRAFLFGHTRIKAMSTKAGKYNELTQGYSMYLFISKLLENFDLVYPKLVKELNLVLTKILNKKNLITTVVGSKEDFDNHKKIIDNLTSVIKNESYEPVDIKVLDKAKEAIITQGNVQSVAQGGNITEFGYEFNGALSVTQSALDSGYLWEQIRELGGAYGCSGIADIHGNISLASYSDPELLKTVKVYQNISKAIEAFKDDQQELEKYIISAIKKADKPMLPADEGKNAIFNEMIGRTIADRQKLRDQILSTTIKDMKKVAEIYKKTINTSSLIVLGNKEKIESSKEIFDNIYKI